MNRTYSGAVKELSELNSFNPELSDVIELTSRQIKLGTSFMEIKSNLNFLGFTHRKADEIISLAQNKNSNNTSDLVFFAIFFSILSSKSLGPTISKELLNASIKSKNKLPASILVLVKKISKSML